MENNPLEASKLELAAEYIPSYSCYYDCYLGGSD